MNRSDRKHGFMNDVFYVIGKPYRIKTLREARRGAGMECIAL